MHVEDKTCRNNANVHNEPGDNEVSSQGKF